MIDPYGRLWIREDNTFILDNRDHPLLDSTHPFYYSTHEDNLLLTQEGQIWNSLTGEILDLPYVIKRFIREIALTKDGILIDFSEGIREVITDVAFLIDIDEDRDLRILIVDNTGAIIEIDSDGHLIHTYYQLPDPAYIIRLINGGYLITEEGYIRVGLPVEDTTWRVAIIKTDYEVVDIGSIGYYDDEQEANYDIDLILDNHGNLNSLWDDYEDNPSRYECTNRIIIGHNLRSQWIRMESIFDKYVGLINQEGEIYGIDDHFLTSPSDLPTEIFR